MAVAAVNELSTEPRGWIGQVEDTACGCIHQSSFGQRSWRMLDQRPWKRQPHHLFSMPSEGHVVVSRRTAVIARAEGGSRSPKSRKAEPEGHQQRT